MTTQTELQTKAAELDGGCRCKPCVCKNCSC